MSKQEKDFERALILVRDLRKFAVDAGLDPWAVRQALIIAVELDRVAARQRGISGKDLDKFDIGAYCDARAWAEKLTKRS